MDLPTRGPSPGAAASAGGGQFVGFWLGTQYYAFRIQRIREIVMPMPVAALPEVPPYVDGVSNLRGAIIPIIDMRALFGLPRRGIDADSRTIVVTAGPRIMGCLVDSVSRVMKIAADGVQAPPDTVASAGRFVEGFATVDDGICILLDVDTLLDPIHLDDVHRVGAALLHERPASTGVA